MNTENIIYCVCGKDMQDCEEAMEYISGFLLAEETK